MPYHARQPVSSTPASRVRRYHMLMTLAMTAAFTMHTRAYIHARFCRDDFSIVFRRFRCGHRAAALCRIYWLTSRPSGFAISPARPIVDDDMMTFRAAAPRFFELAACHSALLSIGFSSWMLAQSYFTAFKASFQQRLGARRFRARLHDEFARATSYQQAESFRHMMMSYHISAFDARADQLSPIIFSMVENAFERDYRFRLSSFSLPASSSLCLAFL